MSFPPTPLDFSHLTPLQRLVVLQLIRVRERAGLSRAQLAQRTGFAPAEIERIETGHRALDMLEVREWCRAAGTALVEFARELDAPIAALLDQEDEERRRAQEAQVAQSEKPSTQLLCFVPDAPPKLLSVENAFAAIELLLGTNQVRVFATDSSATLGFSANDSTRENVMRGAGSRDGDGANGEYTLLRPTGAFLVVAGKLKGSHVSASAPRNLDLSWAPPEAWVSLCPYALDLANPNNSERLRLGSLSPLQLELVLDKFAPQLPDSAVGQIMGAHPDGAAWMAEWND